MKTRTSDNKYSMYNYLKEGETMYDFLDRYLKIDNGIGTPDYSIENLMKRVRSYSSEHDKNPSTLNAHQRQYSQILEKIIGNLQFSLNPNRLQNSSVEHILTDDEKATLLAELQEAGKGENLNFNSIEDYLNVMSTSFLTMKDPYYEEGSVSDKLIDAALSVMTDESKFKMKATLLMGFYMPYITHAMQDRQTERIYEHDDEWYEFNFISSTLSNSAKVKVYDEYLDEYRSKMAEQRDKVLLSMKYSRFRKDFVLDELRKGLDAENPSKDIYGEMFRNPEVTRPQSDEFEWHLRFFKEPQVLMDRIAEYPYDDKQNERVVAVSYGILSYGTMFNMENKPTLSSDMVNLLGVTRIGKDGTKNYFVFMPFDAVEITNDPFLEDDERYDVFVNGEKSDIFDSRTGSHVYLAKKKKIPDELEDFYSSVAFSNEYLEHAVEDNFRYAGYVTLRDGKPVIDARSIDDVKAVRHALEYPGKIGNSVSLSLGRLLRSSEFLARHLNQVKAITDAKDREQGRNENDEGAR